VSQVDREKVKKGGNMHLKRSTAMGEEDNDYSGGPNRVSSDDSIENTLN